jgi:transcriptional regulator with XRE-family HTH domain
VLHTLAMAKAPSQAFWDRLEESSQDVGLPCGLSDIGRELDIWPSAVQKWRDGEGLPGQKNLIRLATNRGVNTEWLKTGRGPKLSEDAMDAATRELLSIWTKLDKDAQERLLQAAK